MEERCTSVFKNGLIWLAGFIIYRVLMNVDIIVGSTLIDEVLTIIICVVVNSIAKRTYR